MKPEILSIFAALAFTFFYLFSRIAVQYSSALSVNLWANGICAILLGLMLPFIGIPTQLPVWPLIYFALAGISSPALAAFFIILGSRRIGVARTGAMGAGLAPLFSSSVAILLLGEAPTGQVIAGTALIVVGIVALSLEKGQWGSTGKYFGYPLLAAIFLALTAIFRKLGMREIPAPVFAAALQNWAGFAFLVLLAPLLPKAESFRWERAAVRYFFLAGLFVTGSLYWYYAALESGDVTIVTPLVHTWPLLLTLASRAFIQRLENITPRTVVSTVFVVGGGFLLLG